MLASVWLPSHFCRMNFPQFWSRGSSGDFSCWRWSSQSLAEAQSLASQAAQQLADRFRAGDYPPKHGGYYPNRPFREQVLHEIKNDAGETAAVVTRNSYGCQVLNTARVMFVDIDLPEPKPSGGFLKKLFGKPDVAPSSNPQSEAMTRIENWTRNNSEWGLTDIPDARRTAIAGHSRIGGSRLGCGGWRV
jgi:hypothetical protein